MFATLRRLWHRVHRPPTPIQPADDLPPLPRRPRTGPRPRPRPIRTVRVSGRHRYVPGRPGQVVDQHPPLGDWVTSLADTAQDVIR